MCDVPRQWLALDVEGIALPQALPATDLIGCYELALTTLPLAFEGARCIIVASGSHGYRPDIRLRLWFWCSRPMAGTELKRWLRDTPACPSVFNAAQLIHTAAPVITGNKPDPLPFRLAEVPGNSVVSVPAPQKRWQRRRARLTHYRFR